jgi:membrane-bound ClpP family serine protease
MFVTRIIVAIISNILELAAIFIVWRWVLPYYGIRLSTAALIGMMAVWAIYAVTTFWAVTRALKKKPSSYAPGTMVGSSGEVVRPLTPEGAVKIKGEIWEAVSTTGHIGRGERIIVVGEKGLKLMVSKSRGGDYNSAAAR